MYSLYRVVYNYGVLFNVHTRGLFGGEGKWPGHHCSSMSRILLILFQAVPSIQGMYLRQFPMKANSSSLVHEYTVWGQFSHLLGVEHGPSLQKLTTAVISQLAEAYPTSFKNATSVNGCKAVSRH